MICKQCGRQNEETNDNRCSFCGKLLSIPEDSRKEPEAEDFETVSGFSQPDTPYIKAQVVPFLNLKDNQDNIGVLQAARKKIKVSKRLILAVFAIAIMLLCYRNGTGSNGIFTLTSKDAIWVFTDDTSNEMSIFKTKGESLYHFKHTQYSKWSMDHKAALVYLLNGDIYYVNANEKILMKNKNNICTLSDNGKYILYSHPGNEKMSLFVYDIEHKKDQLIDGVTDDVTDGVKRHTSIGSNCKLFSGNSGMITTHSDRDYTESAGTTTRCRSFIKSKVFLRFDKAMTYVTASISIAKYRINLMKSLCINCCKNYICINRFLVQLCA